MLSNIDKDEIIEYKSYETDECPRTCKNCSKFNDCKIRELKKDPAIIHYKRGSLEWWADFDENDNEIHFKCNNGFERWTDWYYDEEAHKFRKCSYEENNNGRTRWLDKV